MISHKLHDIKFSLLKKLPNFRWSLSRQTGLHTNIFVPLPHVIKQLFATVSNSVLNWITLQIIEHAMLVPSSCIDFAGSQTIGPLEDMDHAILTGKKRKTKTSIPDQFTICSSVYNSHFVTPQSFFQLMQDDGSSWINLYLSSMKLDPKVNANQLFNTAMFINKEFFKVHNSYTAG